MSGSIIEDVAFILGEVTHVARVVVLRLKQCDIPRGFLHHGVKSRAGYYTGVITRAGNCTGVISRAAYYTGVISLAAFYSPFFVS